MHNDFKYDNLVFRKDSTKVIGVLDWEKATVGDSLKSFGALLAYWFEANEGPVFKQYNCTWLPGNLTRAALINYYASITKRELSDINFLVVKHYKFDLSKMKFRSTIIWAMIDNNVIFGKVFPINKYYLIKII